MLKPGKHLGELTVETEGRECRTCKRLKNATEFWRQPIKRDGVARFYERLAAQKSGQATVSDVQSPTEKETRAMPLCDANG